MMICQGCGVESHHIRGFMEDGKYYEMCGDCGPVASIDAGQADVYWPGKPYYSSSLDMKFESKQHKVQYMKEKGLKECGDSVNGSRRLPKKSWIEGSKEYRKKNFDQCKPVIRETYKRWLEKSRGS